jgi:hypothetical protein
MRNIFNIEQTFKQKSERGWSTLYAVVDLHSTLILPSHDRVEFYPDAVEVIKWWNRRDDFKVILWTSSFQGEIDFVLAKARDIGIRLDYVNENPLEANNHRANFEKKFYFNILFEDKAGFDARCDWTLAAKAFEDVTGEKILEWNDAQKDRLQFSVWDKVKKLRSVLEEKK